MTSLAIESFFLEVSNFLPPRGSKTCSAHYMAHLLDEDTQLLVVVSLVVALEPSTYWLSSMIVL